MAYPVGRGPCRPWLRGGRMLAVFCPYCQQQMYVRPEHAGLQVRCPNCRELLTPQDSLAPPLAAVDTPGDLGLSVDTGHGAAPGGFASTEFPFLGPPQAPGELGVLGGYRVVRLLGAGGMGCVFEAVDPNLGRRVALKVLNADTAAHPQGRQRFLREARTAAALQHEHVVAIHHVGEDNGVPFLVMPLLQGETLEKRLALTGPFPVPVAVRIGREIAEALSAAHRKGLIHRHVKPANVWLQTPGWRVKLLDFGLARPAEGGRTRLTRLGQAVGTPSYLAPEQIAGEAEPRSDLFSLGCVLYEMVTGRRPFD